MLHIYTGSTQANRGSDEFRLHEAYRELRARLDTDGMLDLNTTDVPARGATPGQLIELASTVPFLAQARFVVVEGLLASLGSARGVATEWQPLVDALPGMPDTSHLVLLEPARQREQRQTLGRSPLLRSLRSLDGVEYRQFTELRLGGRGGNEVASWLRARAEARGVRIDTAAAGRLSELIGADLWALSGELDKLAQYAQGRAITEQDVDLLTTAARDEDVFGLVDDAVTGRTAAALVRLRRMLDRGSDSPARLQGLIARQLRNLVRAAALIEEGAPRETIGEATGVTHPFPLGKLVDQASALGRAASEDGLRAVEAADHAVKTGRFSDALALELLITRLGAVRGRAARGGRARSGRRQG
ncbi:MAG: DNA polymerase III subunit delta [Chloroflexi bacterium]|nr:DNA polymerase III subunit delta [Chloroflexota bacterium]